MMKMASLLCEGVSQLTGGRSACFWVSFRKLAVTLLCVEVIFTVTTVNLSVTLWQRPRKRRNDLYCPPDEQHTVINSLMPQHERTRWDHWKEIQWKTYEHVIWLNSDKNKHKDSIPTDDSLRDEMDFFVIFEVFIWNYVKICFYIFDSSRYRPLVLMTLYTLLCWHAVNRLCLHLCLVNNRTWTVPEFSL